MTDQPNWRETLYKLLRDEDVTIFSYVPDAGHAYLIDRSTDDPDVHAIPLTTEEEGVALAAGAHLGGKRSVLLMQSSGAGNCINMLSLIQHGRFPFLTFISMRGDYGEGNPWQFAMGKAVEPTLSAMGVQCLTASAPEDVEPVTRAAMTMAYSAEQSVAVLLSQRLLGAKRFDTR